MSIDAGAQVAIILLACGPRVVIVNCWDRLVPWVELPLQRRLCPIFVSGVGLPDIHEYSAGWRVVNETPRFWGIAHHVSLVSCYNKKKLIFGA